MMHLNKRQYEARDIAMTAAVNVERAREAQCPRYRDSYLIESERMQRVAARLYAQDREARGVV